MTPHEVIGVICLYYSQPGQPPLTLEQLRSEERGDSLLSEARHLCYWFLVQQCGLGYVEAARLLNREHPTLVHGVRAVEINLYRRNWEICTAVFDIALMLAFPNRRPDAPPRPVAAGRPRPAQPVTVGERRTE